MKRLSLWLTFFLLAVFSGWLAWTNETLNQCLNQKYYNYSSNSLQDQVPSFYEFLVGSRICVGDFVHDNGEGIIAIFTVILGFSTWFLWKATRDLVNDARAAGTSQLAVATTAANAAKKSADAAVATERAQFFIFVHTKEALIQIKEALTPAQMYDHPTSATDHIPDFRAYIPFSFKNYGKTPAIIKAFSFQVTFPDDLPDESNYFPRDNVLSEYMIEGGGQTEKLICPFDRGITTREGQKIIHAHAHIWFWGRILYDDCFGEEHEHRFLWKYNSGSRGFRPCYDYPNYIKNT